MLQTPLNRIGAHCWTPECLVLHTCVPSEHRLQGFGTATDGELINQLDLDEVGEIVRHYQQCAPWQLRQVCTDLVPRPSHKLVLQE